VKSYPAVPSVSYVAQSHCERSDGKSILVIQGMMPTATNGAARPAGSVCRLQSADPQPARRLCGLQVSGPQTDLADELKKCLDFGYVRP